jgi:hypothetical protein
MKRSLKERLKLHCAGENPFSNNNCVPNHDSDAWMIGDDNDDDVGEKEALSSRTMNYKKPRTTTTIPLLTENNDDNNDGDPEVTLIHTDNDDGSVRIADADVWRFFTAPVVSEKEMQVIGPDVVKNLQTIVTELEDPKVGMAKMVAFQQRKNDSNHNNRYSISQNIDNNSIGNENDEEAEAALQSPDQNWDPRSYQRALLELAKTTNTIVHLGTGTGKVK